MGEENDAAEEQAEEQPKPADGDDGESSQSNDAPVTVEATVDGASAKKKEPPKPKESILVIEDSLPLRKMLTKLLQSSGFIVQEAEHGKAALKALEGPLCAQYSLIVVDLMMPVMDGFTFMAKLREEHAEDAPPVVICSSRSDIESVRIVQKLGAVSYILKPFKTRTVIEKIHAALGREVPGDDD